MELTPVDHTDFARLIPFFKGQRHRLCSYSPGSILAWRNDLYFPVAGVYDGMLIVGARHVTDESFCHLLLPIGCSQDPPPAVLRDILKACGFFQYSFVPEDYLLSYSAGEVERFFRIKEQPRFCDYVYRRDDLAELSGNRFSKKRNLIHQFEKSFLLEGRSRVVPAEDLPAERLLLFLEEWCKEQQCEMDEDLYCEQQAAENAIRHGRLMGIYGLAVLIDDKVCAFGFGSRLTDDMGVLLFEKAFASYKGLYQYLDRECARRLFKGYRYINKESDMGLAGLKKAKRSYHPVFMVRSYRLILRG